MDEGYSIRFAYCPYGITCQSQGTKHDSKNADPDSLIMYSDQVLDVINQRHVPTYGNLCLFRS